MKITSKEAISLLRTRLKPYNQIEPVMSQSLFSTSMRNIQMGLSKRQTTDTFLSRFGFIGTFDAYELDFENWFLKAK